MTDHVTAFAPGRVNLIGEHTDYNDGLALPFAVAQGVTVHAEALPERRIEAFAEDFDEQDAFALDGIEPGSGWSAFVRGAAGELERAGVRLRGARVRLAGDVPQGAGLSSSAALEVALALALTTLAGSDEPDRLELAKLCSRIENEWVGARTGLLDQLASLYGEPDRALRIDFRSLDVRPVAVRLDGSRLVTLDSGESHTHAGGAYNDRRAECAKACEELGIDSLRDAALADADRLPSPLAQRARHVITENERVERTVAALKQGDLEAVGRLLDESHASLRDCYEISTPAVEAAVGRLKAAGALGARIMGGGFGGSVLGLLPADVAVPDGAVEVRPGPGACVLEVG